LTEVHTSNLFGLTGNEIMTKISYVKIFDLQSNKNGKNINQKIV